MQSRGVLGTGVQLNRRFKISGNYTQGQVICMDRAASSIGQLTGPANNANSTAALGIVLDSTTTLTANPYTTTQANGANSADRYADCTYHPFQLFAGRFGSNATAYAAPAAAANGQILTNSTANSAGLVIADVNSGNANYVGGLVIGLTGNNPGAVRTCNAISANTSITVTVPFDFGIGVNDTFIRLPNIGHGALGVNGVLMTNDYADFMQPAAAATVGMAATVGGIVVWDVEIGDGYLSSTTVTSHGGATGPHTVNIPNPTLPVGILVNLFLDHVFNKRL